MFWRPRAQQDGPRRRLSRPVGCLLWVVALLVLLLVLSALFGGFRNGTKVGAGRSRAQLELGWRKYSSTALARPSAMTCWPRLLAAIDASNGSVMNSGSISAPGIWLGVLK